MVVTVEELAEKDHSKNPPTKTWQKLKGIHDHPFHPLRQAYIFHWRWCFLFPFSLGWWSLQQNWKRLKMTNTSAEFAPVYEGNRSSVASHHESKPDCWTSTDSRFHRNLEGKNVSTKTYEKIVNIYDMFVMWYDDMISTPVLCLLFFPKVIRWPRPCYAGTRMPVGWLGTYCAMAGRFSKTIARVEVKLGCFVWKDVKRRRFWRFELKNHKTHVLQKNALAMNAMKFPREGRFFLFFWSLSPRELQVSSRYRQRERRSSLFVLNWSA